MARVAEPLVGRAAELDAVDRALAGLRDGGTDPILVTGEPGIGKTRLLAELAARADAGGCLVLTGSASELERDLPFWIFVDALDEYVAGLDPHRLVSLDDEVRGELAHMLPSLAGSAPAAAPAVVQDERYRAHRAVRELLERMAATRPLVLALDDVHWADSASVELLAALLRRPPDASVLLALAMRPRQVPDRLEAAFERAHRRGDLARVVLRGLGREEAGELLGDGFDRDRADALHEETGGNPFYLEQLARSGAGTAPAVAGGIVEPLRAIGVPPAVGASLAEELAGLSQHTRLVLRGAAVAGDPFEPELAAAAAGVEVDAAMEAFDELLGLELVRPTDVPRRFRFRHPLVRRAVHEGAPGGWLLGAHERCAGLLAERGASPVARAHHVEYAARHGDAAALALLVEAGTAASPRAPASAARWFSAALRLLPDDAAPAQRVELFLARARALAATGALAAAHADLLESLELVPGDAVALHVQLVTACASVEHLLGRHEEAHARLEHALGELPAAAAADGVALMLELTVDALFRLEYEAMQQWAERAVAAADELGERPLVATALALLTMAFAVDGRVREAEAARVRAMASIAGMTDGELVARPDALAWLGAAETYMDCFADAIVHGERARVLGRSTGRIHPGLIPTIGVAQLMCGRVAEAADVLDAGVEAARLSGVTLAVAWSLRNRAFAAVMAGDAAGALLMAEEALELMERLDRSFVSAWAGLALALAAVLVDQPARAVEVLVGSTGGDDLSAIPAGWRVLGFEVLTRAYLGVGRRDDAARVAARAREHAAALSLPMPVVWAHRAAAEVAQDAGDPAAGARHALDSAAAAEEAGAVVEAALSRLLAGRALAAAGDPDGAAAELERAATAFEAAGAPRMVAAAQQELRRLGRRVYRRSRPGAGDDGLESLTGRELEIARLVVQRRTNPQIAAELFLSLKTVETHMRNIFRKLNVASRIEVAQLVERASRGDAA
jgi:DNA-binding NarL/FixJ family response regulator